MRPVQDPPPPAATDKRPRIRRRLRTPLEARQWRRKITGYGLFGAAFILMVNALVGENGYLDTLRARGERESLTRDIALVRQQNQALKDKVYRLKHDPKALEEAARSKLNMIKRGETMVVLQDESPKK